MKIKMLSSVITNDFLNLQHNGVYEVNDVLGKELVNCKFAIEIVDTKTNKKSKKTK